MKTIKKRKKKEKKGEESGYSLLLGAMFSAGFEGMLSIVEKQLLTLYIDEGKKRKLASTRYTGRPSCIRYTEAANNPPSMTRIRPARG
jgi:hypothetical protein